MISIEVIPIWILRSATGRGGRNQELALARHDSGTALDAVPGALLTTGPTGTNVGDLAVYLRLRLG